MKSIKKGLLFFVGIFIFLSLIDYNKSTNFKWVSLGFIFLFGGILLLIDEIEHPSKEQYKNTFAGGQIAWLLGIIFGIGFIFYYGCKIAETGIW